MPLSSHSLAKSPVNALIGVLVRDGALDVVRPAPAAGWSGSQHPRAAITVDQLAAALARLLCTPGTEWGCGSRGYMLPSRIAGDAAGGSPRGLNDFAHRHIFDPPGMHTATLEFDAAGTMMGAHSVMASPRDRARFALLYRNDGVVAGKRILASGWVRYSTTLTLNTGYGTGFRLTNTSREMPKWGFRWGMPGAPPGAFMARGDPGQYVVIATLHSGTGNGAENAFAIRRR